MLKGTFGIIKQLLLLISKESLKYYCFVNNISRPILTVYSELSMMLIIGVAIALLILWISQTNFRRLYLSSKIPGPIGLPYIGNALLFLNKKPAG